MGLYWIMRLPPTMMSPQVTALVSATGAHDLRQVLLPYANRPDLLRHRMFEQSQRLSLTANVAILLDFYRELV
jgi:hypothetical protein